MSEKGVPAQEVGQTAIGENAEKTEKNNRVLSGADVWAMAFGCIVGWGAFVMPGTTFLPVAGVLGSVIAMAVGALIMLVIARSHIYLMRRMPGPGGVYTYVKTAFGRDHAFLSAWFLTLSYLSIVFLNATALLLFCRTLFDDLLQFGPQYRFAGDTVHLGEVGVASLTLLLFGTVFLIRKRVLQYVQTALAIVLLLGAALTAAVCLPHFDPALLQDLPHVSGGSGTAVLMLVLLAPWAFVGFDVATFETADFRVSKRRGAVSVVLSILCGGIVYIAMSLVSVTARPAGYDTWQAYFASLGSLSGVDGVPVFYAARTAWAGAGLLIVGVTAMAAILTGVIAAFRALSRILSAMAQDDILPHRFVKMPLRIVFITVISIALTFLGYNARAWFVEMTSFGAVVGFGYTCAAAGRLAQQSREKGMMCVGYAGAAISVAFALVQIVPNIIPIGAMRAESFFILSLWCLLGFVFYWRALQYSTFHGRRGIYAAGMALFALLLYSVMMWFLRCVEQTASSAAVRWRIVQYAAVFAVIAAVGLAVMLYVQNLLRQRQSALERETIRAQEGSLAKSRFLLNMSHDIRTPMNAVIGYTNLALKENPPEKVRSYLQKIDASGQHLLALINDILEMSQIENGATHLSVHAEDLCELLEQTHDLFADQMRQKGLEFTVDTADVQHRYVYCDGRNLIRALMNMIGNACKFTPECGLVQLSLRETQSEGETGVYEISIRDNGLGMSEEFASKVFNAFERERTSTVSGIQGTGLGMAITKNLIDMMDGTIDVHSAPGKGTQFVLRIPFRIANAEALAERRAEDARPTPQAQDNSLRQRRLLLVEDNAINMEIASLLLGENGFLLETAVNGREAVDKVQNAPPGYFDAVLMDIQMPVMDGYEAARLIRQLPDKARAAVPIVAMTANAFKEDEAAAREAGMQAHIAKPIDMDKMIATLAAVLLDSTDN